VWFELGSLVLGFVFGGAFLPAILLWIACLWEAYRDYRIAVDYPHLNRRKRLWVFVPLMLLHSGPWALAITVFIGITFGKGPTEPWHVWFAGGFLAYLALTCASVAMVWKKHKTSARP